MRRILPVFIACVLVAIPGLAQRGGGHGGGGGMRGGGGGMHAGGGGGFRGGGGGYRGGGYRGGYRGIGGYRGRYGYYGNFYYYPWLYGGLYYPFLWDTGWGWDYGDYGYPDYGYPYQAPSYSSPSPQVLIISNQPPAPQPIIAEPPPSAAWNAGPTTSQTQPGKYEEPLYLLAMNDGTIRAVLAYWVDGSTVHYVTMDHEQKQTPLGSLDRGLSERLNRERNVTFQLPG